MPQKTIFLVVFLHLLGFTMGGPIVPALREHFAIEVAQTGLITSAFPLGMFGAVFVFPVLSDRIGRKPVLIISYLGVGVGFVLQALALRLSLPFGAFLALRVASGAFAGASTVVKAYIADIASPETLPRVMAYREAAGTLAFIVGPSVGGLLFACGGLQSVVFASGLMSLLAAVLVLVRLRPTPGLALEAASGSPSAALAAAAPSSAEAPSSGGKPTTSTSSPSASSQVGPWGAAVTMMGVSFAYNFGQSFFDSFFPLLAAERFGWQPAILGPVLTGLACLVFVTSAFAYSRLVKAFGTVKVAILGLLLLSCGLALAGCSTTVAAVGAALCLYGIGVPIFTPSVPTILASCVPRRQRGLVLGVDSAVNTVARILAPVVMGVVYQLGPAMAFTRAALVVLVGMGLLSFQQGVLRRFLR